MAEIESAVEAGLQAVCAIRAAIATMTPEDRLGFWAMLQEGYCRHCGEAIPDNDQCYCLADD